MSSSSQQPVRCCVEKGSSAHPFLLIRFFTIIGLLYFPLGGIFAQEYNQVPNPGFEKFDYCPVNFNSRQMNLVKGWTQPTKGTVDYFNRCSRSMGVPGSSFGDQEAAAGDGYIGLVTFAPAKAEYREYLQGELASPMKAGQYYCVQLQVSLADNATFMADGLGIHFSKDQPGHKKESRLERKAQVTNPHRHVLNNDTGWTLLSDLYKATGGEQYITLGNFWPDDSTIVHRRYLPEDVSKVWKFAYYFIDEVVVKAVDDTAACEQTIPAIVYDMSHPPFPQGEQYKRVRISSILFDFDKSDLKPAALKELNKVVKLMKAHPNYYLEIIGHTDVIGTQGYNEELSEERAESVFAHLEKKGIERFRLRTEHFGSEKPVASNETIEGRARNRRVEFVVVEKKYEKYEGRKSGN